MTTSKEDSNDETVQFRISVVGPSLQINIFSILQVFLSTDISNRLIFVTPGSGI